MTKKLLFLSCLIGCTAFMTSCNTASKEKNTESADQPLVGNDRDDHGCIASAGYQWSELLKDCIRPWEKGVKLVTPVDSTSTSAAYLVFNADSSLVEVYLSQKEEHPILHREAGVHHSCWSDAAHSDLTVKTENGNWAVFQNDEPLFLQ